MNIFTTSREKQLWMYSFVVLVAIILTHFLGGIFTAWQLDQNAVGTFVFFFCMALSGLTVLLHGLARRPGRTELAIWSGLVAVYLLLILRLGVPERTHLMEYSVLAVFVHMALSERQKDKTRFLLVGLMAFVLVFSIGVMDEVVQFFLPSRVYDPIDILFNGLAACLAIVSSMILQWARIKIPFIDSGENKSSSK